MGWGIGVAIGWPNASAGISYAKKLIKAFKERVLSYPTSIFEAGPCLDTTLEGLNAKGLLDNASLIITPNAYNTGVLYDVVPNTTLGDMNVVRATTATRVNSAGLIESVGVNIPRIDYLNVSCPSILVEQQRTNLSLNSDGNLSTYDLISNVSNASSSFNSFVNAIQFTSTGLSYSYKAITITAQTHCFSAFIKMDDNSVPILSGNTTTGNVCLVIAGKIATDNLKVESYGNNIYRLSATGFDSGVNNYNGVLRFDTQVLKSFKTTGFQIELGSYATSYIPTVASTVTRNADIISKTGISSLIGQTEGTLFCEINTQVSTDNNWFQILDGGTDNWVFIGLSGNKIRAFIRFGAATVFDSNTFVLTNGVSYKAAIAYKNGDLAFYINGVQIEATFTPFIITNPMSYLAIGFLLGAPTDAAKYKQGVIFKTRLSNTELAQLTTL